MSLGLLKMRLRIFNVRRGRLVSTIAQPPLAFAFDIDGVLIRGSSLVPKARHVFRLLDGNNEMNRKIPYILMTNGGGVGEHERCQRLTKQLGVSIDPSMLLQAHTILQERAKDYADKNVLILGGRQNRLRDVAQNYGFKSVYTPLDIKAWNPSVWPFYELSPEEHATAKGTNFSETPISAAFVFHDPRNWALDIQILLDVILSGGYVGRSHSLRPGDTPVELVFCNPDLLWKSDFPVSRLGQGAFRDAFQAVFKSVTGNYYEHTQYGKPTKPTYDFAKKMLQRRMNMMGHGVTSSSSISAYMVGDNPESDIAGANAAGWTSILVRTGVYNGADGPPKHEPTHIADDVLDAVQWAIRRELGKAS